MLSKGKVPFVEDAKKGAFGAMDPKALQNSSFGNKWSDLRGSGPTVFSMAGDAGPIAAGQCVGALTRIEPAAKVTHDLVASTKEALSAVSRYSKL